MIWTTKQHNSQPSFVREKQTYISSTSASSDNMFDLEDIEQQKPIQNFPFLRGGHFQSNNDYDVQSDNYGGSKSLDGLSSDFLIETCNGRDATNDVKFVDDCERTGIVLDEDGDASGSISSLSEKDDVLGIKRAAPIDDDDDDDDTYDMNTECFNKRRKSIQLNVDITSTGENSNSANELFWVQKVG